MSHLDPPPESEAPEELPADMPLPSDAKTFFLGGIFLLAILMAANAAREIILPLVFAIMLNLLMQPTLRWLERMRVPKTVGALLLILVVFAAIVGIGAAVSGPAEAWIAKLPEGFLRLQERLSFLNAPINALQTFLKAADNFGGSVRREARPGLWMAERFCRAYLRGREASPAGCSPPCCFSIS
jgi:predicted PurR-regulated permease PerM